MKPTLKRVFLFGGIALGCVAMTIATTMGVRNVLTPFNQAQAGSYSLELNSGNVPSELTSDYQEKVNTTIHTSDGNTLHFTFINAKTASGSFAILAKRGYIYNFNDAGDRITGITGITATFTTGNLRVWTSNSELSNGGAYLGSSYNDLTSGSKLNLSSTPMRYFQIQALDAETTITSLKIDYSCDGTPTPAPSGTSFNVEDFESYTATGNGYDGSHGIRDTSNLRSAYYSRYKNADRADPLNGSGWSLMGSTDYLTYLSNKGRNSSKCGLFKVNNGNNFSYIQSKAYFNIPSIIGKGDTLSFWIRGGYTTTDATTNSSLDVSIIIFALYDKTFLPSGQNNGDKTEYVVRAGSDWHEYTLALDPSKEYYAFGIYLMKAGGTIYLPVDDISIYTKGNVKNAPDGLYTGLPTMHISSTFTVPAVISFGNRDHKIGVLFANKDGVPTGYTYNESTGAFTITTTGKYSGFSYGNITGTYDKVNDRLTNLKLNGSISSYVVNNGSITLTRPSSNTYLDCEGSTSLTNKVIRRYKYESSWNNDPGNIDRAAADPTFCVSGNSGLSPRPYSSNNIAIRFATNINSTSVNNIGFWIYNPSATAIKINLFACKTSNVDNFSEQYNCLTGKEFGQGWTFYSVGFRHNTNFPNGDTLYNMIIVVQTTATRVTFDDIVVFD